MRRLDDIRRSNKSLTVMVFVFVIIAQSLTQTASSADLLDRTVFVESSFANETTSHNFSFRSQASSTIESMNYQYCSNSPLFNDPCIAPTGLDVSSFGIESQSGVTGFVPSPATNNSEIVVNRSSSLEPATSSVYEFGNIQNPDIAYETVFVRIGVFDGPDATGTLVDQGAVAFVVEERYDIQAYVPPYLTFCVGLTVALNCSSTNGIIADFGELSANSPTTATSQFATATNDPDGYNTFINGQTMTSGNKVIEPISSQTASSAGTSQFGINLRSNTSPLVGSNKEDGAVANGFVDSNYNTPNRFRFGNGDRLAASTKSTGFSRYTISYIVNVPEDQSPGIYSTTLVYTSIASF